MYASARQARRDVTMTALAIIITGTFDEEKIDELWDVLATAT